MTLASGRVLVAGEALVDLLDDGSGRLREHVGGSPANVAAGLARLDHPTVLATHLGADERGARVAAHLRAHGVVLAPGSDRAPRTSTATARLDEQGAADYDFDLRWELPPVDLAGFTHLHTGSLGATLEPGASHVLDLLRAVRPAATCSYDPNARPSTMGPAHDVRSRIEECVGLADVVKASDEDLHWLYAGAPVLDVAHLWARLGPSLLVLTRGADGAVVLASDAEPVTVPAPRVAVGDTVGAGDSFMAGLLSGLLDAGLLGGPTARARLRAAGPDQVRRAVERALACAAYTVERAGAAAPTRSEIGADRPQLA